MVPDSQPHVTDPTIYGFHPLEDYKSDYGNDTLPVDVNHDKFSVLADSATTAGIKKTLPDRSRSFSLQEYSQEGSIFNDQAHCDFVAVVDEQPLSPEVPLLGLSQSRSLPRGNPRPMLGTCRAVSIPDASFSIHIPSSPLTKKSIPKGNVLQVYDRCLDSHPCLTDKYSKRPRNDEGPGHQHDPCCDDDAVFQAQHEDLSAESSHKHKATSFLESQKCRDTDACTRRSHKRSRTSTPSQDIQQPSYELVLNEPGPSKFQDTSSDDFDTWEATVATPEVLRLRKELTSQNCGMHDINTHHLRSVLINDSTIQR